ncbi:MAG: FAD-binding oxidoreductase [Saprospiraceae bacterium]|nr:FAD-binding oxidoreductase [Saprospiraceae bacterium]
MSSHNVLNTRQEPVSIPGDRINAFADSLRGRLLLPGHDDYETARTIWNAMIDKRPALIVECAGVADVMLAVRFGREFDLLTAVKGAGHNIAGNAVCEGGLMIDLSGLNAVHVDPRARRAHAEPGATLGDVDHETQAFGLAVPTGINSTTGIAGLTLGGGFGWLTRKHGVTVDNLLSADVVTAEGQLVRASVDENPDLFWGIRGGGGNFGIVTSFEFALHPVGPEIFAGLIVFPFSQAKSVLQQYRAYAPTLPEEANTWAVLRKAPPLPFLPESVHGTEVVVFANFCAGPAEEGEKLVAPIRAFGTPVGEHLGVMPYTAWQQAFDPLLTPGMRNYWKSHNFTELADGLFDTVIDTVLQAPSPHCEIFIGMMGGAYGRVAMDATAYTQRDAEYVINVHGRWETPAGDEAGVNWARAFYRNAAPFATGGVYVNFMPADEADRVAGGAYKPEVLDRLRNLKTTWDPTNFFRLNQNIQPA